MKRIITTLLISFVLVSLMAYAFRVNARPLTAGIKVRCKPLASRWQYQRYDGAFSDLIRSQNGGTGLNVRSTRWQATLGYALF